MRDHHLRMRLESRLYSPGLPLPEDHVTLPITAADPFPVWREPHLASISSDGVASKSLVPRLTEIVSAVDKDLIVQRLRSKVFLCTSPNGVS